MSAAASPKASGRRYTSVITTTTQGQILTASFADYLIPTMHKSMTRRKGIVRCAINTRKSSEEGLEQEFNSLQAQREACEAFISSQRHEGWACLPKAYDDGGFSGATTDRPALQRLLADIATGRVDTIVVYKIER